MPTVPQNGLASLFPFQGHIPGVGSRSSTRCIPLDYAPIVVSSPTSQASPSSAAAAGGSPAAASGASNEGDAVAVADPAKAQAAEGLAGLAALAAAAGEKATAPTGGSGASGGGSATRERQPGAVEGAKAASGALYRGDGNGRGEGQSSPNDRVAVGEALGCVVDAVVRRSSPPQSSARSTAAADEAEGASSPGGAKCRPSTSPADGAVGVDGRGSKSSQGCIVGDSMSDRPLPAVTKVQPPPQSGKENITSKTADDGRTGSVVSSDHRPAVAGEDGVADVQAAAMTFISGSKKLSNASVSPSATTGDDASSITTTTTTVGGGSGGEGTTRERSADFLGTAAVAVDSKGGSEQPEPVYATVLMLVDAVVAAARGAEPEDAGAAAAATPMTQTGKGVVAGNGTDGSKAGKAAPAAAVEAGKTARDVAVDAAEGSGAADEEDSEDTSDSEEEMGLVMRKTGASCRPCKMCLSAWDKDHTLICSRCREPHHPACLDPPMSSKEVRALRCMFLRNLHVFFLPSCIER